MCFNLGKSRSEDQKSKTKRQFKEDSVSSLELSSLREITVRIVHAGGREELLQNVIYVSNVLERYPGTVVAKPGIFKHPDDDSVLAADDKMLPGQKYYVIPSTTVEKIKQRHAKKVAKQAEKAKKAEKLAAAESGDEPSLSIEEVRDVSAESNEDSFMSAKEFYFSREEEWPEYLLKRFKKKTKEEEKKFVPPIRMPKMWKELGWQPSLNSIQEVSP